MTKFIKFVFASIIGGVISAIIIILLLIGIFSAVSVISSKEAKIKENTILVLDLNRPIVDRVTEDPFAEAMGAITGRLSPEGLNRLLKNIKKAKRDSNIAGIYLEAGMPLTGYATIEEIREALIDFKSSGKFVYSFAPVYSQKGYYLASAGSKIYLNPSGMLQLNGLYAESTFYKGTLDKLGIEMQVFKHGKFKSAVEPFLLEEMSSPSKLQTEVFLNSMWKQVKSDIAKARGIEAEAISRLADKMPSFLDQQIFIKNNIIDGLKYKDEVIAELKKLTKTGTGKDLRSIKSAKYAKVKVPKKNKKFVKDKIAVIYAEGEIDGMSDDKGIKSKDISKAIRKARRDSTIKAIVFRVNSPGGSGLGSEIIWREIQLASEAKPLVVSMGDYAASGGYYISCAAGEIIANPTTLTGSIGVFGLIPNIKGLANKIGLSFDGVKTNKFSDMPSITRPFRKEEKDLMQNYVERFYNLFLTRCAEGRETTNEMIDKIAQGRVWSGSNALDINLVDKLGGLNNAIEIAKEKAGLEAYRLKELPVIPDPIEQLLKELSNEARMLVGKSLIGEEYKHIRTIENLKNSYPVQARIPYDIEVK